MLDQYAGMSPAVRALVAADAVIAHPEAGPTHVELAIRAALTDYRRGLVRLLVEAGVAPPLVWRVVERLPVDRAVPRALVGPLAPEVG